MTNLKSDIMTEQLYFINAHYGGNIPCGVLSLINEKMQSYDRCIASATTLIDICLTLNKILEDYNSEHKRGRRVSVKLSFGEDAYIHVGRITYTCLSVNENLG